MFLVKDLPEKKVLKKLLKGTKGADASSTLFTLQFMKTASDILLLIDKFFTSKNFSHGRFTALSVLSQAENGGLFPYEIADGMGVSRATASGLIKGLEGSGYVASVQSETDGRMKTVKLTDEGAQFLKSLTPEYYKLISSFTDSIDKKTMKQFSEILTIIGNGITDDQA